MSTCRGVQVYICIVCTIYKTSKIKWERSLTVQLKSKYCWTLLRQPGTYISVSNYMYRYIFHSAIVKHLNDQDTSHEQCTYFRSYNVFVLLLKEFYSVFSIVFCRRWSSNCWPFRVPPISWGRWLRKWPTSFARTNTTLIWRPPFSACTTSVNKSRGAKMYVLCFEGRM